MLVSGKSWWIPRKQLEGLGDCFWEEERSMPWRRVLWRSSGCAKREEWQGKKIHAVGATTRRNPVNFKTRENAFRAGHNEYFLHSWLGRLPRSAAGN